MPVKLYRLARWFWQRGIPLLPQMIKIVNRLVFSVVLPPSAQLGKGVLLSYQGLGTVIHRRAVIGDYVTIGAGVTIGGRSGIQDVPTIGKGAMIGSGAKVLGPVRIGQYASIGANAVVLTDIEDYAVAVGIPARVIKVLTPDQVPNYFSFESSERES
jgi:serine O-acetyltransferase